MQSPTNNNNQPTIVVIVVSNNLQNAFNCGGDGVTLQQRNQHNLFENELHEMNVVNLL